MKRLIVLIISSLLIVSCGISAYPTFNDSPTDLSVYRERNRLKSENAALKKRVEELEEAVQRLAKQISSGGSYNTAAVTNSNAASNKNYVAPKPALDQTREVHVSGHYRTVNGKQVWIRPHTRSRPGYKKR